MESNRRIARVLDAIILIGLALYVTAVIVLGLRGGEPQMRVLLGVAVVGWIAPGVARARLIVAPDLAPSRLGAYSQAKTRPHVVMLIARWLVVPLALTSVVFNMTQHIAYGGLFGQLRAYGLGAWMKALVADATQAVTIVVLFAAFLRGVLETVTFLATCIRRDRAAALRRRAEITWNLLYFAGLPTLLAIRLGL